MARGARQLTTFTTVRHVGSGETVHSQSPPKACTSLAKLPTLDASNPPNSNTEHLRSQDKCQSVSPPQISLHTHKQSPLLLLSLLGYLATTWQPDHVMHFIGLSVISHKLLRFREVHELCVVLNHHRNPVQPGVVLPCSS